MCVLERLSWFFYNTVKLGAMRLCILYFSLVRKFQNVYGAKKWMNERKKNSRNTWNFAITCMRTMYIIATDEKWNIRMERDRDTPTTRNTTYNNKKCIKKQSQIQ